MKILNVAEKVSFLKINKSLRYPKLSPIFCPEVVFRHQTPGTNSSKIMIFQVFTMGIMHK
jgi:hypothetical protein